MGLRYFISEERAERLEPSERVRKRLEVGGIVQGVGFRPFVYQLARRHGLAGWVLNDPEGVKIEVEGPWEAINRFVRELQTDAPALAEISDLKQTFVPPLGETQFEIRKSRAGEERRTLISPDTNVCADCLRELFDPNDRRYRYPFINCTNCGPRYTIIERIPYDRPNTTMSKFPMCAACSREYHDPADRRFHAQPVACPECGPRVELWDAKGRVLDVEDPIRETAMRLKRGEILAIKGLGGFHLAVDATNEDAVRELRRRKRREQKPLAVMSGDLASTEQYARFNDAERELLLSFRRPIVLLRKKLPEALAPSVAPRSRCYGVMLPYTPIQYLLFAEGFLSLVMTSGNLSDEPICIANEEAAERLQGIADAFLVHDRDIHARSDDSVTRVMAGRGRVLRRARGYVPMPTALQAEGAETLAVGAELKGTIALAKGRNAFLSQHLGDLKSEIALNFFEEAVGHLQRILEINPKVVAHDLHPDYLSTRHAKSMTGLRRVAVQHHHAHIAAVLAERRERGPVIGVALDGTGQGDDGTIWGGEFLVADFEGYRRVGHLAPMPLPGGDAAVEEPWRTAVAYLYAAFGPEWRRLDIPFVRRIDLSRAAVVTQLIDRRVNTPYTSSTGRLFDAVSSLLGICDRNSYEGQAPMELEGIAQEGTTSSLDYEVRAENGVLLLDPASFIRSAVERIRQGAAVEVISAEFHNAVADAVAEMCERLREHEGVSRVALSGGCFQNLLLFERVVAKLEAGEFRVLTHDLVPPNDGCIALGQAAVARSLVAGEGIERSARRHSHEGT